MTEPVGAFGEEDFDEFAYDFDKWLGDNPEFGKRGKSVIAEPSTQQVSDFFTGMTLAQNRANNWERVPEPVLFEDDGETLRDETDDEQDARLELNMARANEATSKFVQRRIQLVSMVCSGDPSIEQLAALPHRVRKAFEGYVQGKLAPQA